MFRRAVANLSQHRRWSSVRRKLRPFALAYPRICKNGKLDERGLSDREIAVSTTQTLCSRSCGQIASQCVLRVAARWQPGRMGDQSRLGLTEMKLSLMLRSRCAEPSSRMARNTRRPYSAIFPAPLLSKRLTSRAPYRLLAGVWSFPELSEKSGQPGPAVLSFYKTAFLHFVSLAAKVYEAASVPGENFPHLHNAARR